MTTLSQESQQPIEADGKIVLPPRKISRFEEVLASNQRNEFPPHVVNVSEFVPVQPV